MRQTRARTVPDTIQVELTSRCPLKCPQCYNDPEPRDIDRDILAGYIKEAAGLKVGTIAMGGGEPLMYPHLEYIIGLVSSLGMYSLMATSGAGLSAARIRELKKAGLSHLWVSLNGSTRAIHEQSRDGYHYAVEALHMLQGSGLNHGINWVARKDNVDDFPDLVKLARKMKVGAITVLRLKPDAQRNAATALDGDDLARLGSYIKSGRSEDLQIYIEQCFSLLRISMYGDQVLYNGCPAAREYMAINANGELLPCRHLVYGEKMSGIQDYWHHSEMLDRLRTTEENVAYPCSDCSHLPRCRTCRAVCNKLYGSFYAGERDCPLFWEGGRGLYKPSNYNFIWPLEENNNLLLFNGLTTGLAEIPGGFAHLLEAKQVDPAALSAQERKLAAELIRDGFWVEEPVDELKLIKYAAASQKYNKDVLALTIAPTMDCNFKCAYCYQGEGPAGNMSEEVQDALVEYVSKAAKRAHRLLITWFGGEPLLAKDIIYRLSGEITVAAKQNGCSYAAFMITNGSLLDAGTIRRLKDFGVGNFQVTLDGPPGVHNRRRSLPGGGDSFDLILSNIKELLKNGLQVHIRVNIDGENLAGMEELLNILADNGIKNANIYPARIAPYTEACKSIEHACLNKKEFVEISKKFFEMLLMKGLATDYGKLLPRRRTNYCGADQINSFSVDPEGYLYKCWSDFGGKENNVGNIVDLSRGEKLKAGHIAWLTWDPFDFNQCRKCKYLPLCMGGCPHKGMKMNGGKPECSEIRFHLESIVKNHYRCIKIKKYCQMAVD